MLVEARPTDPARAAFPECEVDYPGRQRRWTVLIRVVLLIPQFIVLYLLNIAAGVMVFIGWFAALALGRLPAWAGEFLSGYLAWSTRVSAYALLLVDRYPPFEFAAPTYPVRLLVQPARLNRLAVFFRLILVIPAAFVATIVNYGWLVCAAFIWLAVLIVGRTPVPLFQANAAVLRYNVRYQAYFLLLTSRYPRGLFGDTYSPTDPNAPAPPSTSTRPLVLSTGASTLLIVFIASVLALYASILLAGLVNQ